MRRPAPPAKVVQVALLVSSIIAGFASASPPPSRPGLESELRRVTERHLLAVEDKDQGAYLGTLHPASDQVALATELLPVIFVTYDLQPRLMRFELREIDGKFAYAHVKLETRSTSGTAFVEVVSEEAWVFREDAGRWKVWSSEVLTSDIKAPPLVTHSGPEAEIYADHPIVSLILSVFDLTLLDCDSLPGLADPAPGAARFCGRASETLPPLDEDDLFLETLTVSVEGLSDWTEVEAGSYLEFTSRGVDYQLTYRRDGIIVIDATR